MNKTVESTTRNVIDYFHFAAVFFGFLLTAAGVITTSPGFTMFGALILAVGMIYFLMQD